MQQEELRNLCFDKNGLRKKISKMTDMSLEEEALNLGKFSLDENVINAIEGAGFEHLNEFMGSDTFFWHPCGGRWQMTLEGISVFVSIEFKENGIYFVPFVDKNSQYKTEDSLLASIICNNLIQNEVVKKGLNSVSRETLYSSLVPETKSLKQCFIAFSYFSYINTNDGKLSNFIRELSESSVSPFRGPLDPMQEDSEFIFVPDSIEKSVLSIWKENLKEFKKKLDNLF